MLMPLSLVQSTLTWASRQTATLLSMSTMKVAGLPRRNAQRGMDEKPIW